MTNETRLRSAAKPLASGLLVIIALGVAGNCRRALPPLAPAPGTPEYRAPARVGVGGALVDVAGGNLVVLRSDLSIDTELGPLDVGGVYNSTSGSWLWSFDISYSDQRFVDPSGAVHDVSGISSGDAIPGTHWVVLDATHLKTKGGLVHDFDAGGRLAQIHWSSSVLPALVFQPGTVAGELRTTSIAQSTSAGEDPVFSIVYDASARVESINDRAGRVAAFSYSPSGLLATARDALDVAQGAPGARYEYQAGRLSAVTNSEGERVEFGYSGQRVTSVRQVGEQMPVTTFAYFNRAFEGSANLYTTRVTDGLGQTTTFRYDALRQLREVENPLGETTLTAWAQRRPLSHTRPNGTTTVWSYSGDDVATELQPSGNTLQFSYAPSSVDRDAPLRRPILRIEDDLGLIEERSYDAGGRLLTLSNGAGETRTLGYDSEEMVASVEDAAGLITLLSDYGEHGHPGTLSRNGAVSTVSYDAVGNLLASPRPSPLSGGVVSRSYDADRNLASLVVVDEPRSGAETISLEWRSDGRLARVVRPYGGETLFGYDALGRLVSRSERVSPGRPANGDWQVRSFEWDALGRPTAAELPNGMRSETEYDAAGRAVRLRTLRSGVVESDVSATFEAGELVALTDPARGLVESYTTDPAGRLSSVIYSGGEKLEMAYDARSRPTTQRYRMPTGAGTWSTRVELNRSYDAAGRLAVLAHAGVALVAKSYGLGRLETSTTANGLVRTYQYAPQTGQLSGMVTALGASQVESTFLYRLSGLGGRINLVRTAIFGATAAAGETPETFYYYGENGGSGPDRRLEKGYGDNSREYHYDHLSNITRSRSPAELPSTVNWRYNAERNRLLEGWVPGSTGPWFSYSYDAAGFVTRRSGLVFTWTARGRVASVVVESLGQQVASFGYDALGRRLSRTANGEQTNWIFGGALEADATGTPVALDLGEVRIDLSGAGNLYRHLDYRGNTKFVSASNGTVVSHYGYGPYGRATVRGSDADREHRFAQGLEIDLPTSAPGPLLVLGARVYDPQVARFLSPDPVFNPVNAYAYTLGNPVDFWDGTGMEPTPTAKLVMHTGAALVGLAFVTAGLPVFIAAGGFTALAAGSVTALGGFATTLGGAFGFVTGAYLAADDLEEIRQPPADANPGNRGGPTGGDHDPAIGGGRGHDPGMGARAGGHLGLKVTYGPPQGSVTCKGAACACCGHGGSGGGGGGSTGSMIFYGE